ncbi:hypothetical protein MDA_GLEAN10004453 [Myotis davidii]|uniref:Uncharacterized protein n=1 Tax=Myotis davidii TaxID=225400 RepID=L5LRR4_MYODS|nr:hypothetical protein MDA_GLEAN10004453 [Myotis davidii]
MVLAGLAPPAVLVHGARWPGSTSCASAVPAGLGPPAVPVCGARRPGYTSCAGLRCLQAFSQEL